MSHLVESEWDSFAMVDSVSQAGLDSEEYKLLQQIQNIEFDHTKSHFVRTEITNSFYRWDQVRQPYPTSPLSASSYLPEGKYYIKLAVMVNHLNVWMCFLAK